MPRSGGNHKLRLIYLYKLLFNETDELHPLSRSRLCDMLYRQHDIIIDRKTFYDDIYYLELLGADIQMGEKKGTYFLGAREFEMPELHLLVDAIQSSQFISPKKSEELIGKLTSLCSKHQAQQLRGQVYLAGRNKTVNESVFYTIDTIYRAITANHKLSFRYFSWDFANGKLQKAYRKNGERYIVSPRAVAWNDEKYYLIAFDESKAQLRHYRIDKMEQVEEEIETAFTDDGQRFDSGSYTTKLFNMYGGTEQQVTLRFDKDLLGVAIDQFGKNAHLRPDDEEHFILITDVIISPQFFGFLFSLEQRVELLAPSQCVEEYKKQLKKTQSLYR